MNWREFWNRQNSIYVNARHSALHYDLVARGIASLVQRPESIVLDYGSGEAAAADLVARACARLYLYDAAPSVQAHQRLRFSRNDRIVVLDTDGLGTLPDHGLDLIVANSLIQYLTPAEFSGLLDFWHGKLKAGGRLVVADVVHPESSAVADTLALLRFAFQGGFLIAACLGLVSTFFSDYRKLRSQVGLARYSEAQMLDILAHHGFVEARRMPTNLGHNPTRMMFEARVPQA